MKRIALDRNSVRDALSLRVGQACGDLGIHCENTNDIADYILEIAVALPPFSSDSLARRGLMLKPGSPKVQWLDRRDEDRQINPVDFLWKYWGHEMNSGDFFQADLRKFDNSLFEAIRGFCRQRNLDPKEYLPPPLGRRNNTRSEQITHASIDMNCDVFVRSPTLPNRPLAAEIQDNQKSALAAK